MIIGLGGIGCRTVCNIYQQFMATQPVQKELDGISFICFDTDAGDIAQMQQILPKENVVKTSADKNTKVSTYISAIQDKSKVLEWFDTSKRMLMDMTLSKGAGQIRMTSRLALMSSIYRNDMDIIRKELNRILKVGADSAQGNEVNIQIVSSLAGGTGAGSFLQMAYFIKEMMMNEFGIEGPQVTGNFILADILEHDPQAQFDSRQKENTGANTYACIKELNGIITLDEKNAFNIELEYCLGMKDTVLPNNFKPYDIIYLYGYMNEMGQNLGVKENYYQQMADNIFLNVFSPVGVNTRTNSINDILQQIQRSGTNRYAATGISKIIYPYKDLINYFAVRRVFSNLEESWSRIDNDYREVRKEYNRQKNAGMNPIEPQRGRFFMTSLESYKDDEAQMLFRTAYNETRVLDQKNRPIGSKAEVFYQSCLNFMQDQLGKNDEYNAIIQSLGLSPAFLEKNNPKNELEEIQFMESGLFQLKEKALQMINENRLSIYREIVSEDVNVPSRNLGKEHRLNHYIIKKDSEMHPLAVRYFLYEFEKIILPRIKELGVTNLELKNDLERYSSAFDIKETEDIVESAEDAAIYYQNNTKSLLGKVKNLVSSKSEYKNFKEDYAIKSRGQMSRIQEYCILKLEEEVLKRMMVKIALIKEQYEKIFDLLPSICISLENTAKSLRYEHIGQKNITVQYVLKDPEVKDRLYDESIGEMMPNEFPKDLCRSVYVNIYDKVIGLNDGDVIEDNSSKISDIFTGPILQSQQASLHNDLHDKLDLNVLAAIGLEARLTKQDTDELIKKYIVASDKLAIPMGPKNIEEVRRIDAWAYNPAIEDKATITEAKRDEIFALAGGGKIICNKFFSKYEITRAKGYFTLEVPKHFPEFQANTDTLPAGSYYKSYMSRIDKMLNPQGQDTGMVTPHLDKRWHGAGYFPNIGEDRSVVDNKIYRAFFLGLVFNYFYFESDNLNKKWQFVDKHQVYHDIKDANQTNIEADLAGLMTGLYANPHIVDFIIEDVEQKLNLEKRSYRAAQKDRATFNKISILAKMKAVNFVEFEAIKKTELLNGLLTMVGNYYDSNTRDAFFTAVADELIEGVLIVAQKDNNTLSWLRLALAPFINKIEPKYKNIFEGRLAVHFK